MQKIDIGDHCTYCGRDTSFGSVDENGKELLLRVNRIPSTSDGWKRGEDIIYTNDFPEDDNAEQVELVGYQCVECQQIDCDDCGKLVLDYEIINDQVVCEPCQNKHPIRYKGTMQGLLHYLKKLINRNS